MAYPLVNKSQFGLNVTKVNEVPSGTVNSSNTVFDTAFDYISGSIEVFRDGQLLKGGGNDYTETDSNTITFTTAPETGSVLLVRYQTTATVSGNADTVDGQHAPSGTIVGTTDTQTLTNKTLDWDNNTFQNFYCGFSVVFDGGSSAISAGKQVIVEVPYDMTITGYGVYGDQSGSIQVDIWNDSYANFPPTDADSITASAPVAISGAQKSEDNTLTGWTTSLSRGDILIFYVDSCSTIQKATISIRGVRV